MGPEGLVIGGTLCAGGDTEALGGLGTAHGRARHRLCDHTHTHTHTHTHVHTRPRMLEHGPNCSTGPGCSPPTSSLAPRPPGLPQAVLPCALEHSKWWLNVGADVTPAGPFQAPPWRRSPRVGPLRKPPMAQRAVPDTVKGREEGGEAAPGSLGSGGEGWGSRGGG